MPSAVGAQSTLERVASSWPSLPPKRCWSTWPSSNANILSVGPT